MKLFHWDRLDSCSNHATGDAAVMAPDLETARSVLKTSLEAWAAENREWAWSFSDDPDDRAALQARIDADVASEPAFVHDAPAAVVVRGSD